MLKSFFIFIFSCFLTLLVWQNPTPLFDCDNFEHTLYLYSASSNAKMIRLNSGQRVNWYEKGTIKGESVFTNDVESGVKFAKEFVSKSNASLVFLEQIDNILCEYYYSPKIFNYLVIKGKRVNIHLVLSPNGVTIATPIAFDSF